MGTNVKAVTSQRIGHINNAQQITINLNVLVTTSFVTFLLIIVGEKTLKKSFRLYETNFTTVNAGLKF